MPDQESKIRLTAEHMTARALKSAAFGAKYQGRIWGSGVRIPPSAPRNQ
jgi:hypothetical protein